MPARHRKNVSSPRLTLGNKIVYGVGDVANSVKTILSALYTLYFYSTVMGLSGTLVGVASALGLAWDAVIDPYIGYLSDRSRARFGRRHVFMLAGALALGPSFWLFFRPPAELSGAMLFAWFLVTGLLVRTANSVFMVPHYALGAELSEDYDERSSITAVRGALALLGTLGAASLSFVVFFPDRGDGSDPKLDYDGYLAMGASVGTLMFVAMLVTVVGTLQWRGLPAVAGGCRGATGPANFVDSVAESLRNRPFRMLFVSSCLFFLGVTFNTTLSMHYMTHYAGVTSSSALGGLHLAFFLGALVGVVLWLRLTRIVDKHFVYLGCVLATAAVMACGLWLVGEGTLLGRGNVRALAIGHGLGGLFSSVLWFLPPSMVADIAEADETRTGQRRDGALFGVLSLGQQLAAGVCVLLAGTLVDHFAGLVPGRDEQSATTERRIGMLYALLPAILLALSGLAMLRYSLGRSAVEVLHSQRTGGIDVDPQRGSR